MCGWWMSTPPPPPASSFPRCHLSGAPNECGKPNRRRRCFFFFFFTARERASEFVLQPLWSQPPRRTLLRRVAHITELKLLLWTKVDRPFYLQASNAVAQRSVQTPTNAHTPPFRRTILLDPGSGCSFYLPWFVWTPNLLRPSLAQPWSTNRPQMR